MKTISSLVRILSCGAFCAGCSISPDASHRFDVSEKNDLGVASVQTERSADHGNQVFTLRAFSAAEQELASVQLTIGELPAIWAPTGTELGSEILISVVGTGSRMVSLETQHFELDPIAIGDPVIVGFLELGAVAAALDEAHIVVNKQQPLGEQAYYGNAMSCPNYDLNVNPVANQCCAMTNSIAPGALTTYFVIPPNAPKNANDVTIRHRNPHNGTGCTASDGLSGCSALNCFYGPNGFSTPALQIGSNAHISSYALPNNGGTACTYSFNANHIPDQFANVTGTFPNGGGCCANNAGPCNLPGFVACSTCGGGGAVGHWDYGTGN